MSNMRLSTKALSAMLITFAINIAWISALCVDIYQLQALGAKEREQALLLEQVNEFTQLFYELQGAFITLCITNSSENNDRYQKLVKQYENKNSMLMSNSNLLEEQRGTLREVKRYVDSQPAILDRTASNAPEDRWSMFSKYRRVFLAVFKNQFQDESREGFREFLLPQRKNLDSIRERLENRQRIFTYLLLAGLAGNVLIALLIHYFFSRYVSKRVEILVSNAQALSQRKALLQHIDGTDDFAIIDDALHQSQTEILESQNFRQSLMQMIAHDLKSPLAASQVSLALIMELIALDGSERVKTILGKVISNNKRLLSLISDLLTIDALDLGHLDLRLESHSIRRCVDEAIETLESLSLAKGIHIENEVHAQNCIFDYPRIVQVLVNLLSNAIKFSKKNSKISVQSEENGSNSILIKVVDAGCGIAAKDRQLIFQKYSQTAEGKKASGTGLGLAITKLIIESHHQDLGFESTLGKGSVFWFTLPRDFDNAN